MTENKLTPAQERRVMHAMNANPLLCEPCKLRWYDCVMGQGEPKPGLRLAVCRRGDGICEGYIAHVAIVHGKRAANQLRKALAEQPPRAN